MIGDCFTILFGCLVIYYSYKLYKLTRDKNVLWLVIMALYGLACKLLRVSGVIEITLSSSLMTLFWALLFIAVFGIYRCAKRILDLSAGGSRRQKGKS